MRLFILFSSLLVAVTAPAQFKSRAEILSKYSIATLADGSQLETQNLRGKSVFDDSYTVEAAGCSFADGMPEVGLDTSPFINDEIVLTVARYFSFDISDITHLKAEGSYVNIFFCGTITKYWSVKT